MTKFLIKRLKGKNYGIGLRIPTKGTKRLKIIKNQKKPSNSRNSKSSIFRKLSSLQLGFGRAISSVPIRG
jgi:hypothetical protein